MSDKHQKPKSGARVSNDSRKNKKAFKTPGASRNQGTTLTEVQKVNLGGGLLRNAGRRGWVEQGNSLFFRNGHR